jgi:small neutral amino acid transporter SnatA (MarC family)
MNLKKEIRLAKYLLPLSAVMLAVGVIMWLVAFISLANNNPLRIGGIVAIDILVGLVLFVVGIADRAISKQRDKASASNFQTLSIQVGLGAILIIAIVCYLIYLAALRISSQANL